MDWKVGAGFAAAAVSIAAISVFNGGNPCSVSERLAEEQGVSVEDAQAHVSWGTAPLAGVGRVHIPILPEDAAIDYSYYIENLEAQLNDMDSGKNDLMLVKPEGAIRGRLTTDQPGEQSSNNYFAIAECVETVR